MRSFRSDNNSGLCPEAIQAINKANDGSHTIGYGEDDHTERAVAAVREIFGTEAEVYFVATGTAANLLAIASLTETWQRVICHEHSHYNQDESTGPERITHCRTVTIEGESSKISPEQLIRAARQDRGDVHQAQPGVVTVSNPTEFGEVYTPEEMTALCEIAHERGYRVHVDGARFANAVAFLDCDPRDLTDRAGVDALSFGATKNGLACSEAVLAFPQGDGRVIQRFRQSFEFHRKAVGHLLSKQRFITAPFTAVLRDGIWLRHAARANAMAKLLDAGLSDLGFPAAFPVQSNGVFVALGEVVDAALSKAGHEYYSFGFGEQPLFRFMCSYDSQPADIEAILADAKAAIAR